MSMNRRRLLLRHEYNKYIHFEDKEVERICLEKWDKDGDGKLSKEEALQLSNIGNLQMPHDCKFHEFKYFENATNAVQFHFPDTNVEIVVPSQITTIPIFFAQFVTAQIQQNNNAEGNAVLIFLGEIKEFQYYAIYDDREYRVPYFSIVLPNTKTPPKFNPAWKANYGRCKKMYVPNGSVELYKAANIPNVENILPMSEYKGNY